MLDIVIDAGREGARWAGFIFGILAMFFWLIGAYYLYYKLLSFLSAKYGSKNAKKYAPEIIPPPDKFQKQSENNYCNKH